MQNTERRKGINASRVQRMMATLIKILVGLAVLAVMYVNMKLGE